MPLLTRGVWGRQQFRGLFGVFSLSGETKTEIQDDLFVCLFVCLLDFKDGLVLLDGFFFIPERTADRFAHCAGDRLSSYPKRLGHLHFVARPLT